MKAAKPWYWHFSITLLFLSTCVSAYIVHAAVLSVRDTYPAENYANLALNLFGIPTFLFQALVQLQLIAFCVGKVKQLDPTSRVAWMLWFTVLLAAVTLTTVLVGNYLTR